MTNYFVSISLAATFLFIVPASATAQASSSSPLHYGTWGFDLDGADPSVRPGDDFFAYANGKWLDRTNIPADASLVTLRSIMTDRTQANLHDLLEEAAKGASHAPDVIKGKVGAFYKAFMNEDAVEALAANPIIPILEKIKAASNRDALAAMMGRSSYDFLDSFFALSIDRDAKNPTQYAVAVNQAGLGLPDRSYYLDVGHDHDKLAYRAYAERLLRQIDWPDPAGNAERIIALETRIAQAQWTKADARIITKTYNPMTIAELRDLAPGFPWQNFLAEAKLGAVASVIVGEKSAFPKLASIFAETPVETLQAWLAFRTVSRSAMYLSHAYADAYFEMYKKTLQGQAEQQARWKRGVFVVSGDLDGNDNPVGDLGWAVGQLYGERYFTVAMRDQAGELVRSLIRAFRARLETRDWMSPATRTEALAKLDALIVHVGYPEIMPRDYAKLTVLDDDPVGNVRRAAELEWDFQVGRLSLPVDRADWAFRPQVNNAANYFYLRSLTFPAALLQAPMYDPLADPAINYGAFGAYAGHEITHSFDDQGRSIDSKGVLRDWWSSEESDAFKSRSAALGDQYSAFEPLPGVHIDSALTMGENIADLGGVTIALDAYHQSLNGRPAPVIDGLTGDQRVFLGWAQMWRGKLKDEALRKYVASDPHSPRPFRVNGVFRNIDAWYAAFGVMPGDRLYVAPERRVRIW
jgi:putative endopeptidase